MFLVGPLKQLTAMFEKGRVVASLVYIGAMFLTLFSAIKVCLLVIVIWRMVIFLRVQYRQASRPVLVVAAAEPDTHPGLLHHPAAGDGVVSACPALMCTGCFEEQLCSRYEIMRLLQRAVWFCAQV